MKKALCIIGAGLVAGGTALAYLCTKLKGKTSRYYDCRDTDPQKTPASNVFVDKNEGIQAEVFCEGTKSSSIGTMYSRHEDAAATVKDSVETIRANVKISENIKHELDEVSGVLDEMLREG